MQRPKMRVLITTLIVSLIPLSLTAQDTSSLTIDTAVARALDHHPLVAASRNQSDASRLSLESARQARLPRAWASGTATQFEEPMVVTPIHGFAPGMQPEFDSTTIQASLALDYSILDGGSLKGRIGAAEAATAIASEAAISVRQTIAWQAAATYLNILSLARSVDAQDQRIEALHEEQKRVGQLLEVGRAAEVDRLRVEAAVAAAFAERITTASQLDAVERSLARITSLPVEDTRADHLIDVLPFHSTLPTRDELIELASRANPRIQMASQEALSRESSILLAEAILRPKLNFVAAWNEFGSPDVSFANEWQAGFQLRIPLYDGGAARKQVAAATASWHAAEDDIRAARLELEDAIDQVLIRLDESRATIESLTRAVDRYAEVVRIEKLRLDLGAGTQSDYLRAEADLVDVRTGLTAAHYRTIIHRIELARLTGELDEQWLSQQVRTQS